MKLQKPQKIAKILAQTANVTQYSPEVVSSVIEHSFKFIREFIRKPTHAGLRIQHLGVIRLSSNQVITHLKKLIFKLRKDRTDEESIAQFKYY